MGLQSHPPHLNTDMKKRDGGLPCHCRNLWRCAGRASAANPRPGVQSAVSANRHPEQLSLSILQQLVLFTWPSNLMFMMTAEPASGTGGESDSVTCLTVSGFPAGVSALLRDLLLFAMQRGLTLTQFTELYLDAVSMFWLLLESWRVSLFRWTLDTFTCQLYELYELASSFMELNWFILTLLCLLWFWPGWIVGNVIGHCDSGEVASWQRVYRFMYSCEGLLDRASDSQQSIHSIIVIHKDDATLHW